MKRTLCLFAATCIACAPTGPVGNEAGVNDAGVNEAGASARRVCARPLAIESAVDIGAFSLPSSAVLSRDGVSSGLFQQKILWTFGDTFLQRPNGIDGTTVVSATGGWSTAAAPLALSETVSAEGVPSQLIPYTSEEIALNRADPIRNGVALWPGPVIDTGSDRALVLFQRIRRMGSGFAADSLGTARVRLDATVGERAAQPLFTPQRITASDGSARDLLFGSAGVSIIDGFAYFFACAQEGFLNNVCRAGRVAVARADDRSAFVFWDGAQWQPDAARAAKVIDEVGSGLSITFNPWLRCYLSVSGVILRSAAALRASEQIESGWGPSSAVRIEQAPNGPILAANMGEYDYLFLEHPALRSEDGRSIVLSYSRPLGNFRGEVRLIRVTLR